MVNKRAKGSWENHRNKGGNRVHSPEGIAHMRDALRWALTKYYTGIAESMWEYTFDDDKCHDMVMKSRGTVPEKYLFRNGQALFFEYAGQIHCLPFVFEKELNLYGYEEKRRAVPVNYIVGGDNPTAFNDIYNIVFDDSNSVVIRNDIFGSSDAELIDVMVGQLVDNAATLSQLQLLAKSPFLFRTNQDNLLTVKNIFTAIAEDAAAIYLDDETMPVNPVVESTQITIDTGLMDLFSHWDMIIKQNLGIPCTDIHKRAQQSVDETNMQDDAVSVRRQEKFKQRKLAIDRLNELFGTHITVKCVIESNEDNRERGEEDGELAAETD